MNNIIQLNNILKFCQAFYEYYYSNLVRDFNERTKHQ